MPAQKLIDKHCLRILNMEPVNIPSNNSHHQLMAGNEDCDSLDSGLPTESSELEHGGSVKGRSNVNVTFAQKVTVVVLCFVNLINYMDRFTIAGILTEIKSHFQITDDKLGLLQTAFVLSYMIFAPLFGYLGDRYSRRAIMAFGVFLWSLTTLLGSLMESFHWFLMFRALVGIGEASYSTIAPTIISDLFVKDVRSKMLALFYFAIPVGSGLGYIVGSETFKLAGQWQWALRVTPVLGSVAIILILFCMQDPVRGLSEGRSHVSSTPWLEDIKDLCRNRSFMLSTAGFTCVAFVAGALAWWGPTFIWNGLRMQPGHENASLQDVSYIFGIITMISGLVGVALGSFMAQMLRPRWPRADPLICAFGLLMSAPLLFLASITPNSNIYLCYTLIFFGEVFLNLNWSLVADILLYVVVPNRRSTAEAFQILISHAFGDAGSPYLIGVISECLKAVLNPSTVAVGVSLSLANSVTSSPTPSPEEIARDFRSLQYALFTTSFVEVLGGFFFLLTAQYILKDKEQAHGAIACVSNEQPRNMYADQTLLTTERLTLGT